MKPPLLGIIADDLTGACDTAAQLTSFGFTALCSVDPNSPLSEGSSYDALAVNSQSRRMTVQDAEAAVSRCIETLEKTAPRIIFKKIDTALRGNVAAETAAILGSRFSSALLVAAIPRIGRTTREGRQLYRGLPLEKTSHNQDPFNPTPFITSRIPDLFCHIPDIRMLTITLETIRRPDFDFPRGTDYSEGKEIYICDAETQEDIDLIARKSLEMKPPPLFVGSLGLMESLAKILGGRGAAGEPRGPGRNPETLPRPLRVLVACGSSHPASQAQIESLIRTTEPGRPSPTMPAGVIRCLNIKTVMETGPRTGSIGEAFAAAVQQSIEKEVPDCLVVIGGETAFDLCRKLGIRTLEVIEPFETVTAISKPRGDGYKGPPLVVTKGGSVGEPDILIRLLDKLMKRKTIHEA